MIYLAVAVGGAVGALMRYLLGGWIQQGTASSFPWGTLLINVTGSLFLGVVVRVLEGTAADPLWRAFLAIGIAGGYTTFSTFSYETLMLLQDGQSARALLYAAGSLVLGLAAVFAGFAVAGAYLHWRA